MGKRIEVKPGDRYGRWEIIQEAKCGRSLTNGKSYRMVECRCECGTIRTVKLESLRQDKPSQSCGCLQVEAVRETGHRNRTHGISHCPTYVSWSMMKQRCYNPNDTEFAYYGGRGITVCERWRNSFEAFLEDMGERPSLRHSIDRFPNNDGPYELGNARWATPRQQNRNRRSNVMLTFQGETMCLVDWAERIGLKRKTLEKRLNHHGFTVEEALTVPLRGRRA